MKVNLFLSVIISVDDLWNTTNVIQTKQASFYERRIVNILHVSTVYERFDSILTTFQATFTMVLSQMETLSKLESFLVSPIPSSGASQSGYS